MVQTKLLEVQHIFWNVNIFWKEIIPQFALEQIEIK